MKILNIIAFSVLIAVLLGASTAIRKDFEGSTGSVARIGGSLNYGNSTSDTSTVRQIDTLTYLRPSGLSGASFCADWGDSVKIVNVIMMRVIAGREMAVQVGDTVIAAFAATAATAKSATITLAPLADAYRFYVKYDTTANGFTSNTVKYHINQQF